MSFEEMLSKKLRSEYQQIIHVLQKESSRRLDKKDYLIRQIKTLYEYYDHDALIIAILLDLMQEFKKDYFIHMYDNEEISREEMSKIFKKSMLEVAERLTINKE